jgi:glutamate decarboxylase
MMDTSDRRSASCAVKISGTCCGQVCWERFANYFEVEERLVPMSGERFHLDAESALPRIDKNTIAVVAILGSTFDGSYEPVAEICAALDKLAKEGGPDVPVHVDGASGAMIAPFLDPELVWYGKEPLNLASCFCAALCAS